MDTRQQIIHITPDMLASKQKRFLTFLIDGFLIVYFLGKKGFCRFICPWGAFLKIPNNNGKNRF